jgi:hypothetical protein
VIWLMSNCFLEVLEKRGRRPHLTYYMMALGQTFNGFGISRYRQQIYCAVTLWSVMA